MSEAARLDPRLTPARPDLASASLRGRVEAARFVEGRRCQVLVETLDLKRGPRPEAPVDTQLLFGETVVVFDEAAGWSWVQAERDAYVGYVATQALGYAPFTPTHRVTVNRTFIYPAADMKQPVIAALPLDGRVAVVEMSGAFVKLGSGGYVVATHLAPVEQGAPDFVSVAEQLIGTPYLWGGKSSEASTARASFNSRCLWRALPCQGIPTCRKSRARCFRQSLALAGLRRGDLVFWSGHVGIMTDTHNLLHANGHHMLVIREPLHATQARITASTGQPISSLTPTELSSFDIIARAGVGLLSKRSAERSELP